jgi:hypothetical protein
MQEAVELDVVSALAGEDAGGAAELLDGLIGDRADHVNLRGRAVLSYRCPAFPPMPAGVARHARQSGWLRRRRVGTATRPCCEEPVVPATPPPATSDFYDLEALLDDEDRALLLRVRDFMDTEVQPIINEYWTKARFPR